MREEEEEKSDRDGREQGRERRPGKGVHVLGEIGRAHV